MNEFVTQIAPMWDATAVLLAVGLAAAFLSTLGFFDDPPWWTAMATRRRIGLCAFLLVFILFGSDKSPVTPKAIFRLLLCPIGQRWELADADASLHAALTGIEASSNTLNAVEQTMESNDVATISFDWHVPDRLPYNDRQNVMAWTTKVCPTNINGVLYEDHYVAFNGSASTNPAVILIEYARMGSNGVERQTAQVVTNSYPNTSVVNLQSGGYTCYWFRVAVPEAYTNCVRNWNGEALFGAPAGSGSGFDLLGMLVIDADDGIWVGATTNAVFGGVTNVFKNGIRLEDAK